MRSQCEVIFKTGHYQEVSVDLIFLIYLCLGNQADPALRRYE